MKVLGSFVIVLCMATFAQAQTPQEIVSRNRAKYGDTLAPQEAPILLRAIATDLTQTQGFPYGLLPKTAGNQCGGYACDIICSATFHWDVFESGPDGGQNQSGPSKPQWLPKGVVPAACELVGATPGTTPTTPSTPPQPPQPAIDWQAVMNRVATLEITTVAIGKQIYDQNERIFANEVDRLNTITGIDSGLVSQLRDHDTSPSYLKAIFGSRLVQMGIAVAGSYFTFKMMQSTPKTATGAVTP